MNGAIADGDRGREARSPGELPSRGWIEILRRTWNCLSNDNIDIVAAGVAFYGLLALFPALGALVSIYGLVADPAQVRDQTETLSGVIPQEALTIINDQLQKVASGPRGGLGFGAAFGIVLALWSATKGTKTLFAALNIAYHEQEKRGIIRLNLTAILFTLGAVAVAITAVAGVVVMPAVFAAVGIGGTLEWVLSLLRWPILAAIIATAMAVLYRFGPSRRGARWQWLSWGAVVATLLWLLGSAGFSIYVRNFASYNETYGSLGAVVILLMWMYLSAYILLLGAELNAEMERQTLRDTTVGKEKPIGRRGAFVADHKA